ncbi:hypothetical protein D9M73_291500 [compost metagenome]
MLRHGFAGQWWRFVPREQWPQDGESTSAILKVWSAEYGDCRQELVFIGQQIDFSRLNADLDACLLSDSEWESGPQEWELLPDPFDAWHGNAED